MTEAALIGMVKAQTGNLTALFSKYFWHTHHSFNANSSLNYYVSLLTWITLASSSTYSPTHIQNNLVKKSFCHVTPLTHLGYRPPSWWDLRRPPHFGPACCFHFISFHSSCQSSSAHQPPWRPKIPGTPNIRASQDRFCIIAKVKRDNCTYVSLREMC